MNSFDVCSITFVGAASLNTRGTCADRHSFQSSFDRRYSRRWGKPEIPVKHLPQPGPGPHFRRIRHLFYFREYLPILFRTPNTRWRSRTDRDPNGLPIAPEASASSFLPPFHGDPALTKGSFPKPMYRRTDPSNDLRSNRPSQSNLTFLF